MRVQRPRDNVSALIGAGANIAVLAARNDQILIDVVRALPKLADSVNCCRDPGLLCQRWWAIKQRSMRVR
jgi:hypothetical protein